MYICRFFSEVIYLQLSSTLAYAPDLLASENVIFSNVWLYVDLHPEMARMVCTAVIGCRV